jgi:signal transduction histidine kinase
VEATIAAQDGMLEITIRDRGAGMDPATRDRAFEQFYRSDAARRLAPDGSGVGLYAASGLMRAMGGRIAIDSNVGEGTAVTLQLPAEPSDEGLD